MRHRVQLKGSSNCGQMNIHPNLATLCKLGAIAVHVDELLSVDGRELDKQVLQLLLADPDVKAWIKAMGALLPVKRLPNIENL